MKFIQRYKSPNVIGIGDKVRYQNNIYDVLINYRIFRYFLYVSITLLRKSCLF